MHRGATNPKFSHRYVYCLNNPVRYIDPYGWSIRDAIDTIRGTRWSGTPEGQRVIDALDDAYNRGEIDIADLPPGTRAQYDPNTGQITIDTDVDADHLPGRLSHEGTHREQDNQGQAYGFNSEREAFDNAFELESEVGIEDAFNPSDDWIRENYGF